MDNNEFNKSSHKSRVEEIKEKKKIPIYILILIGLFFIALIIYMLSYWANP